MPLSVIGAGLGRTGTMSLKIALEQLGFGPCYHMTEVFQHKAFEPWDRAGSGQPVDWEQVFAGYQSAVDWPACNFYRPLAEKYPKAKVILTLRDADAWFDSTQATIFRHVDLMVADQSTAAGRMFKRIIADMFAGQLHDRARCVEVFNRHNAEVQKAIPAERLLVFYPAQGWAPLCRFLGVPVPDQPFPRANTTEEFLQRFGDRLTGG